MYVNIIYTLSYILASFSAFCISLSIHIIDMVTTIVRNSIDDLKDLDSGHI